jgi:Tfp pilus assembly protein PilV
MKHKRVTSSPFTLVEVMVVFVFTGIAIAAGVALLQSTMWATNFMQHRTTGANIAEARLEKLRSLPYEELTAMTETNYRINDHGNPDSKGHFYRTTIVGSETHSSREVTIEVRSDWKYDEPRLMVKVVTVVIDENVKF